MDPGTTEDEKEEGFEMVTEDEVKEAQRNEVAEKVKAEDEKIDFALDRLEKEGVDGLEEADLREIVQELRHLEEKLHLWREVRQTTVECLREIADYMDEIGRKAGVAKVVGSGGGVLAGGLTVAGGVMTVMTAGAALPVLVAGASLGLASGITGGAAAITKKVLNSQQMKRVEVAIEVDSAATKELATEVEAVRNDNRVQKVAGVVFTVGGLASGAKGLMDVVKGATPGQTIIAGLEAVGGIFGENVNKEIAKLVAQGAGKVLSGTVTSVFGGVTMLWDMYQLREGVKKLAEGGEEGAEEIRKIADQLEQGLTDFGAKDYSELDL